jgi:hypothetical protein
MSELHLIVRNCCAEQIARGGGEPRDIAEAIFLENSDLCEQAGENLLIHSLTEMVRKQLKQATAQAVNDAQVLLPGLDTAIICDLPAAVAVPTKGNRFIYRPLLGKHAATIQELELACQALEAQIAADTRKANALREFLAYRIATAAVAV